MFTGIIETLGKVVAVENENSNLHFTIESKISHELKVDQSLAHNGVCLTVVKLQNNTHTVTAIDETLQKTNLSFLKINDTVNLERALKIGDRLDGHFVQGHIDATGICTSIENKNGSIEFIFTFDTKYTNLVIEKGSICVNGVSLTCFNVTENNFTVAIIPYTLQHTNFSSIRINDSVNIEFDILGKYLTKVQK